MAPRQARMWWILAHYHKNEPPLSYYVWHYSEKDARDYLRSLMPHIKIYDSFEHKGKVTYPWPFNFHLSAVEGGEPFLCWDDWNNRKD